MQGDRFELIPENCSASKFGRFFELENLSGKDKHLTIGPDHKQSVRNSKESVLRKSERSVGRYLDGAGSASQSELRMYKGVRERLRRVPG